MVFIETQVVFFPETEGKVAKVPGEGSPGAYATAVWGCGRMLMEIKSGGLHVFSESGSLLKESEKKGGSQFLTMVRRGLRTTKH